jgi:hypothetical protein
MESLVSLLKAVGPGTVNAEVRSKILELLQSWATAAEGRYELGYIGEVYRTLQREGFQFPPRVTVASSMIDSSAVCFSVPVEEARTLTLASRPNGLTLMSVCGAERRSRLPTESTTVGTVETASTSSARPRPSPFLTSASSKLSVWTTGVTRSSRTSLPEVAE